VKIVIEPMTLRSIFVAIARSGRAKQRNAASEGEAA
jgi:hypothetical protein